ncbi:hypothetical protein WSS_A22043 [Rhodococcus opacus M213]|uniref:Transmembrane protein n=1 Tax=Rhodococcus opacus M213 TaxID=1129896 RepID=K8XIA6_RHOOP|nr:hypothetical protein [Rhodococcus opacus]EKT80501.1 hypothetical protein WSS_A22043 [Rhodococcus opacus M213]
MDDQFLDSSEFDRYDGQFQRDLEIYTLNLKLHVSEEGHWLAKGRKILRWHITFAVLACIFMIIQLCNWGEGSWWLLGIACSAISYVFAFRHYRVLRKAGAASEAFRALEPPASLRPLRAAIDAQIEEEDRVAAEARRTRRWWRR